MRLKRVGGRDAIVADIQPRKNSRARCSGCGHARPGYDRAKQPRLFHFVPLWNLDVHLRYRTRLRPAPTTEQDRLDDSTLLDR